MSWADTMRDLNGYEAFTTFWEDFSIADKFGIDAVNDTFRRAFKEWKKDYKYLTELVLVLNHKIWQHYQNNEPLARVYNELWEKAVAYAMDHLKDEKMQWFLKWAD